MSGASVADRLAHWARRTPDAPALIFLAGGEEETARWSYAALYARAVAIGARLRAEGADGQPVALLYPPGPELCAALFGCFLAGALAVPAPFNPRTRMTDRVRAILASARPCAILTADQEVCDRFRLEGETWLATAPIPAAAAPEAFSPPPDGIAFLQYTSGSTGAPKGVVVDHAALSANLASLRLAFGVDHDSVLVSWLPVFHDMGLVGKLLLAIDSGRPCVLMPPLAFFQSPIRWLRAISRYSSREGGLGDRSRVISGAPTFAYELCVQRLSDKPLEGIDLARWRTAYCGSEPVRARTLAAFAERFGEVGFEASALTPCYGMAETTLIVSSAPLGRAVLTGPGGRVSCGAPIGCELRVVDPATLAPLPPGETGDIYVRGESLARGYWNAPDDTAAVFDIDLPSDGPGFLKTGDRGYLLEGEIYLAGRTKDILIHRGANIDPDDVESAAQAARPCFTPTAAAFAVEQDDAEVVVLVLEVDRRFLPLADPEVLVDDVVEAVADKTGLRLHDLILARPGSIPRTTSGKVQRGACRALYLSGELREAASTAGRKTLTRWAERA